MPEQALAELKGPVDLRWLRTVTGTLASMMLGVGMVSDAFWRECLGTLKERGWQSPLKRHIRARLLLLLVS